MEGSITARTIAQQDLVVRRVVVPRAPATLSPRDLAGLARRARGLAAGACAESRASTGPACCRCGCPAPNRPRSRNRCRQGRCLGRRPVGLQWSHAPRWPDHLGWSRRRPPPPRACASRCSRASSGSQTTSSSQLGSGAPPPCASSR
eukprot:scaffold71071_cov74-Phaeocystis_antarctica.AAC.4